MNQNKFEIGSKISAECIDTETPFTGIVSATDGSTISFRSRLFQRLPVYPAGTEVKLRLVIDDKTSVFHGRVRSATRKEWVVRDVEQRDSWEQREYFRYKVNAEGIVRSLMPNDICIPEPCQLVDISAVGTLILCTQSEFAVGDRISVIWEKDVPNRMSFRFNCEVVRASDTVSGHFYGCRFMDISDEEQTNILKALYGLQQLEYRKAFLQRESK